MIVYYNILKITIKYRKGIYKYQKYNIIRFNSYLLSYHLTPNWKVQGLFCYSTLLTHNPN